MSSLDRLINKLNTTDIIRLLEYLGLPESQIVYSSVALIIPTICHNALGEKMAKKLYYYEESKRFYCYTHCHSMSIIDFIINVYAARGFKIGYSQAYTTLESIVSRRISEGFAILEPPTKSILHTNKLVPDWEKFLTVYNHNILDCFTQKPKYLEEWLKEGIDYDILVKFGIKFDMVHNRMVVPILDHKGRLVGIKARNFNARDIEEGRKYIPLWHNEEIYRYPKMMVAYGLYQNRSHIKRTKEVIIMESEKSVLKMGSFLTLNRSVAIGGSSVSIYHGELFKSFGVEKTVLALDNDWDNDGDKFLGLKKMVKEGRKLLEMGFTVEIIYDYNQEYLDNHDSPVDKGRSTYSRLYRHRLPLDVVENMLEEKEHEV